MSFNYLHSNVKMLSAPDAVSILLLVSVLFRGLFSPHSKAEAKYKVEISGKLVTNV